MLRLSSKSDFELPSSQGKEHPVGYISVGVRKEEAHQLSGGGALSEAWLVPGIPPTGALRSSQRLLLTPFVGKS